MPPDILALLSGFGVSGQVIGYIAMSISIATILVRYLPKPGNQGVYSVLWTVMTSVANLKIPPVQPQGSDTGAKLHSAIVGMLFLGILSSFVACSPQAGVTQQAQQLAADVDLIAGGLQAALPEIVKIHGIPATTIDILSTDFALVQKDAAEINAALNAHAALPANRVQEIANVLGTIVSAVLPGIPNGAEFIPVVQAAQALMPELLAAVGIAAASAEDGLPQPEVARMLLAGQIAHARLTSPR